MFGAGHLRRVNAAVFKEVDNKIAELIIRHAADKADLLSELVQADGNVAGRAAQIHGEGFDFIERAMNLVRVEVQSCATDYHNVAVTFLVKIDESH